ncbi:MAG: mevalonate kinase [Oligoflexia bacterium]
MNWPAFKTRTPAKWVWSGEHAVLRGATAIAFPHPGFKLELEFVPGASTESVSGFEVEPPQARSVVEDLLHMIQDEQNELGRPFYLPQGVLRISSSIPSGAGLGSSAALCVAMARWLSEPLGVPEAGLLEFATHLEHRFHGKSSGMDVAVCAVEKPVSFVRGRGPTLLSAIGLPKVTFHDTGLRASTSECIRRVEAQRLEDPVSSIRADDGMARSSRLTLEALSWLEKDRSKAIVQLAEAMRLAHESFLIWALVPGAVQRQIEALLKQGALAAKLTGAGGGGFVIAIWPDQV